MLFDIYLSNYDIRKIEINSLEELKDIYNDMYERWADFCISFNSNMIYNKFDDEDEDFDDDF